MELWIRSQNKTALMKIIDIRLYPDNVYNKTDIFIRDINGDIVSIGSYKTRERALEILDEIQRKIKFLYMYENADLEKGSCIEQEVIGTDFNIYEMPKE